MSRPLLYALWALVLFVLALVAVSFKPRFDLVVSDARYYYVYLPSVVLDGDLDFRDEMIDHWAPIRARALDGPRTDRGLVPNKFPVGVSLTLSPAFLLGHGIALATGWPADGYSPPYQIACLAWILTLCWLAALLCDDLLRRGFGLSPGVTTVAILGGWVGSPLLYYTFREPFMSHAIGWFWVTLVAWLGWRAVGFTPAGVNPATRYTSIALLAFAAGMAVITRPTNLCIVVPLLVWFLVTEMRSDGAMRLLRIVPLLFTGLIPVAIQLFTWHALFGRWVVYSYGDEGFRWGHPEAWRTLFSSRHGLFFWSPLLLGACVGVVELLRSRRGEARGLLLALIAGFVLLWYCNSCWWCWWFGDACGGRAYVELTTLFLLGLGGAFELLQRASASMRYGAIALTGAAIGYSLTLLALYVLHAIPRGTALAGF